MTYFTKPNVQLSVGPDKVSIDTRCARGVMIAAEGPNSDIYAQETEIKVAVDNVVLETKNLRATRDAFFEAEAIYKKARTALCLAEVTWDGVYDVLIATGEKHIRSEAVAATLALEVRTGTKNPIAMPLQVAIKLDLRKNLLRIRVKRAPGMDVVCVQYGLSQDGPWTELAGHGALQVIQSPQSGIYWARAASRTAHAMSDFTTPVSVIVK